VRTLSAHEAQLIMEVHGIDCMLESEEETDLLEQQNPELLNAYLNLQGIADGSD